MNTPRTEKNRIPNSDLCDWGVGLSNYVDVECSRNLELELNEAKAEIKRLQDWKASQMAVESELDAQMLAKKLGAPIGSSCRKEIQKRVLSLIEAHSEAKAAIKDAYWQLLPFLKPGDEKTKAVLEGLQRFM